MLIIGFGYRAQNGKDTAVEHLVNKFGQYYAFGQEPEAPSYDIRRYAFGDLLKEEFYDVLNCPMHSYWAEEAVKFGNVHYLDLPIPCLAQLRDKVSSEGKLWWIAKHKSELGNHLQIYATEYARARDNFYWVNAMRTRLEEDKPQVALISDVRFLNEMALVKSYGGFTVKVTRRGFVLNDGRSMTHASETQLDGVKFDYEIEVEEGCLDELKADAETVFNTIVSSLAVDELSGDFFEPSQEVA